MKKTHLVEFALLKHTDGFILFEDSLDLKAHCVFLKTGNVKIYFNPSSELFQIAGWNV